jgi:hypothetical protein
LDECWIKVRIRGEGGAEDRREELLGIAVFEVAFEGARYWCSEGGEDDDVVGVLFEDLGKATADGGGHFEVLRCGSGRKLQFEDRKWDSKLRNDFEGEVFCFWILKTERNMYSFKKEGRNLKIKEVEH